MITRNSPALLANVSLDFSVFPIGNCAEYDVIANVQPNLLQTGHGQQFEAACQQQRFFGFLSFPIGNCAEYDVIGNVQPNLLQTEQGLQFEAACQQHLDAFNAMMQDIDDIHNNMSPEDILRRYFENTRRPNTPKFLKYEWNSEAIGGFELTAVEKW